MHNSKSLVVPYNMQEHGHLLLHRHPSLSLTKPLSLLVLTNSKKRALFILIMDIHFVSVE
jgi:hypothetical protein